MRARAGFYITLAALISAGPAMAQSASVTAGPNGTVSGRATAPGAPAVGVEAGQGGVVTSPEPEWNERTSTGDDARSRSTQRGKSVTVRSPDGSSTSSAWTSGDGASAVAGSGPRGSTVTTDDDSVRRDDSKQKGTP